MFKKFLKIILILFVLLVIISLISQNQQKSSVTTQSEPTIDLKNIPTVDSLRQGSYPGSTITIEKKVATTDTYDQYITFYKSEGLKIYALMTIPKGQKPSTGWPVIVWNHGKADPKTYGKQNDDIIGKSFAPHGYLVYQPSYRGHAGSDGDPSNTNGYLIDALNAIASIKKYDGVDSQRIGLVGHSLGSVITLDDLVISTKDIKAAVLWSVGFTKLSDRIKQAEELHKAGKIPDDNKTWQLYQQFIKEHGTMESNPAYWKSLDPLNYLSEINIPLQLDGGGNDTLATPQLMKNFYNDLKALHKNVTYNEYPGAGHVIFLDTPKVYDNTITFLDKYLK
jgi:dipeptidyl aminopeptidase/acylaminoacyl peptidase